MSKYPGYPSIRGKNLRQFSPAVAEILEKRGGTRGCEPGVFVPFRVPEPTSRVYISESCAYFELIFLLDIVNNFNITV